MIAKFYDNGRNGEQTCIEFGSTKDGNFRVRTTQENNFIEIELLEQELFDLIGYLLRIQSKIRKESK